MIEVTDLQKIYSSQTKCCSGKENGRNAADALIKTSFDVAEHECFSLLGENGAGKSTCFKILTREERRTNGDV